MKPYYQDNSVTIYHGDCLELLPLGVGEDALVTDPPWNMDYFRDDNKSWTEYASWLWNLKRVSDEIPGQVWFLSTKAIPFVAHLFEGWSAFASVKNFSQMKPTSLPNCWDIAFIRSTQYLGNGRNWHLSNTAGMMGERTDHPTPRSLGALSFVIGMHGWKTILDPFMGSGTTLRASKDLGRKAIGIEIEEKYCEIAARRMEQEVLPLNDISNLNTVEPEMAELNLK